ncbi:hypothetical protein ACN47E_007898 [Coniothyrium glycines]
MRLLYCTNDNIIKQTEDLPEDTKLPPYAILSHTWEDGQEITFNSLQDPKKHCGKGYKKIIFCAEQAQRDGLQYFWVDTCCINKEDVSELQHAINSMFRWYQNSCQCYVYLSDVSSAWPGSHGELSSSSWMPAFDKSRWFTRGWTLQELLAPTSVKFFSHDGVLLGDKTSLRERISQITGIPQLALQRTSLRHFSTQERISWATSRYTTKPEDKVYSLLGIFGVTLVMNYGEGVESAFRRLKNEIEEYPEGIEGLLVEENKHWIIPRMINSKFVGRTELIRRIRYIFRLKTGVNGRKQERCVIIGTGGLGKSEVCLQIANLMREDFWGIFWIDVGSRSTAKADFMRVANAINFEAEKVCDVVQALANIKKRWLLILDNADNPATDYSEYFPPGEQGSVLMTSRLLVCSHYGPDTTEVLDALDIGHATELLLKCARIPRSRWAILTTEAQKVVEILGSHTLAIIQAGAYIAEGYCDLQQYPGEYERQRTRLSQLGLQQDRSRYNNVYATFEASIEVLKEAGTQTENDALVLLAMFSMLTYTSFPLNLLEDVHTNLPSTPMSPMGNSQAREDWGLERQSRTPFRQLVQHTLMSARRGLRMRASLAHDVDVFNTQHVTRLPSIFLTQASERDTDRVRKASVKLTSLSILLQDQVNGTTVLYMHPVVHAWARDRLQEVSLRKMWVSTGCMLVHLHRQSKLWRHSAKDHLQPHLHAFLEPAFEEIFSSESPDFMLPMMLACGWMLNSLREDERLERLLSDVYKHLSISPRSPSERLLPIWDLAVTNLLHRGNSNDLVQLLEHIVAFRSARSTQVDQQLLGSQQNLAIAYAATGQTEKAIAQFEQVVNVHMSVLERASAADTQGLLASIGLLRNLGIAYNANGQIEQAIAVLQHVVTVELNIRNDKRHESVLKSQHALANVYVVSGRGADAIYLLEEVVENQKSTLPRNHPDTLTTQHNLAIAYQYAQQLHKALELIEHVANIRRSTLPENHPFRLLTETQLGSALRVNGRVEEANAILETVVRRHRSRFTEDHPHLLSSQYELALTYQARGQVEDAIKLLEHVCAKRDKWPKKHPQRVESEVALSSAYENKRGISRLTT